MAIFTIAAFCVTWVKIFALAVKIVAAAPAPNGLIVETNMLTDLARFYSLGAISAECLIFVVGALLVKLQSAIVTWTRGLGSANGVARRTPVF